jgi:hypothetical protein
MPFEPFPFDTSPRRLLADPIDTPQNPARSPDAGMPELAATSDELQQLGVGEGQEATVLIVIWLQHLQSRFSGGPMMGRSHLTRSSICCALARGLDLQFHSLAVRTAIGFQPSAL